MTCCADVRPGTAPRECRLYQDGKESGGSKVAQLLVLQVIVITSVYYAFSPLHTHQFGVIAVLLGRFNQFV